MNECFNPSFLVPRYGHVVGTLWARCGHVVGMLWDKSADSIPALSMRIKQAFDLRGTKQDPAFSIDEMKCAKPLVGRWSLVVGLCFVCTIRQPSFVATKLAPRPMQYTRKTQAAGLTHLSTRGHVLARKSKSYPFSQFQTKE